ncbi:hypothetical protein A45J_1502 [hot springs metagenome]|uniref:Type II secretion system protein n=1 Tax=hot springs metagenome TaxID=433727 RepID=A0A5J4L885_9ZZZZ
MRKIKKPSVSPLHPFTPSPLHRKGGFTLIELAMVLVVIGIVISLGVGLIGPLTKRVKYTESKEIVNAAVESVIGYAITNSKLPDNTKFPTIVRSPNDAWTKPLAYVYDKTLKDSNICDATGTNITVKVCPDISCSTPISTTNNVSFIVLSGGGNYNNQTSGSQEITSSTTIRVYEPDVDNIDNYTGVGDINRPEPYDDIVKWIPLEELKTKIGCTGTPTPPSACGSGSPVDLITNDKIYYCYYDTNYSSECDNVDNACQELKNNDTLSVNSGEKIRLYSKKRGNKCNSSDAFTVNPNSKPCLEYNSGGVCTEIKPVDTNNNCQVQGSKSGSIYTVTDK